jgi:hypothetical protein
MANAPRPSLLVIERILRDRDGIWRQISEDRDLRGLSLSMLSSSVASLAIYGLVLGSSNGFLQAISSMIKLPLLFLVTLAICLPTLYLFNLVFGARLSMTQAVALIMVAITVISVLTLAFAPISLFFLITAQSYQFFKLLNVGILVLTAIVGLRFLTMGMAALNGYHAAAAKVPVQSTVEPFVLEPTVDGSVDGSSAEPGTVQVAPARTATAVGWSTSGSCSSASSAPSSPGLFGRSSATRTDPSHSSGTSAGRSTATSSERSATFSAECPM